MNKVLAVIPARYASSRLPAKVLKDLGGKSIIQRVYEQVKKASLVDETVIAVDNKLVLDHVIAFGGRAVLTDPNLISGTDRCAEVVSQIQGIEYVVNVQGDEPFIEPQVIDSVVNLLKNSELTICSMMNRIENPEDFHNPNVVKLVIDHNNNALYFSRSAIPHQRGTNQSQYQLNHSSFRHMGIYGFRKQALIEISKLPTGSLEKLEMLEQLRWLENGYKIKMGLTTYKSMGIDTEEDLNHALRLLQENKQ